MPDVRLGRVLLLVGQVTTETVYDPALRRRNGEELVALVTALMAERVHHEQLAKHYRLALDHIAGQRTIAIGNPYGGFARDAIREAEDG